jgi:3-(methylsulfanyl)propanoyl-CoA dehydrogenase
MTVYQAPQREMKFVMDELLDMPSHYASLPGCEDATVEIIDAIREEGAKFAANVLSPLNRTGDEEGCTWSEEGVKAPSGFRESYDQFRDAGWPSLMHDPEFGGQGLPFSVANMFLEMCGTANYSWATHTGVTGGAIETLHAWGTEEQKNTYIPKLVEGIWSGTMCLTEPHAGTDLGLLRTKAEPQEDGSYSLSGTKIFITQGEQDLSDNIIHIVIARIAGAPEGTDGISLFIVPKYLPDSSGEIGERNTVTCGAIEHKMGLNASPTCVMNFDGAKGYLIGPANKGLQCMFTFMNNARLGCAVQGLGHAEFGYQQSLVYAKDRLQMRALTGPKKPDLMADPIIVHPDVRRMLLTQKCIAEGGRMFTYDIAKMLDVAQRSTDEELKAETDDVLGLLTPIAKAFLTEQGHDSANLAVQCFGGHGYIKETGAEQNVRDARIGCLYEGTTGIQALDLIGRKVLGNKGVNLMNYTKKIHAFCKANQENPAVAQFTSELSKHSKEWGELAMQIGGATMKNPDEMGAASVDFLMYSGYVVLAYYWAQAAVVADKTLKAGTTEENFYKAKISTAKFYFQRLLPKARGHVATMNSGADNLMELDAEHFSF